MPLMNVVFGRVFASFNGYDREGNVVIMTAEMFMSEIMQCVYVTALRKIKDARFRQANFTAIISSTFLSPVSSWATLPMYVLLLFHHLCAKLTLASSSAIA